MTVQNWAPPHHPSNGVVGFDKKKSSNSSSSINTTAPKASVGLRNNHDRSLRKKNKKLDQTSASRNGKKLLQHPLVGHPELPKLTEMQQLITQAILTHGEPCPFDKIYEYVNEKWKGMKIKRRDGAPYSTDCRRAIQANLRQCPNHMPLFAKGPQTQWYLVRTATPSPSGPPIEPSQLAPMSSELPSPPELESPPPPLARKNSKTDRKSVV